MSEEGDYKKLYMDQFMGEWNESEKWTHWDYNMNWGKYSLIVEQCIDLACPKFY